jgi:hypothetical protein
MSSAATPLRTLFFDDNIACTLLGDLTRALVEQASPVGRVVALADGTLALEHGRYLLGSDLDEESLLGSAQSSGAQATFVVFGLGLGHTVRGLRAFTAAPIVVFEPEPGILRSYFESGPSDLGEVTVVCTIHDLTQVWQKASHGNQSVTVVNTPGYSELFPEQATLVRETVAQLVQRSGVNDATHRLRGRVWIEDVFANVDVLREHPSFLALAGKYRGVPAFIVGAGPSLGKNGKHLADAAKKGIVIALNSSARALESYGVEPQVLACMESIDVSHLLEQVSYLDRVVRLISLTAHPRNMRAGSGPLLPVFEGIPQLNGPLQALLDFRGLAVSGSVSTLAFSLAERLGCSPIVLVGQDLAYTNGQAYAPGSPYQESRVRLAADGHSLQHDWCNTLKETHNKGLHKMQEREPLREAMAWGGQGTVMSTIGFSAVRDWLEAASIVLQKERPELRLVNATEGGARISGFEESALAELLATLPTRKISAESIYADAKAARAPLAPEQITSWCAAQKQHARAVRHAARRIRRLCAASRVAIQQNRAHTVATGFHKLEIAERQLKEAVARMPFVDAWAHANIDDELDKSKPVAESRDEYDQAVRAVALEAELAQVLERSASELEAKFAELAHSLVPGATHVT